MSMEQCFSGPGDELKPNSPALLPEDGQHQLTNLADVDNEKRLLTDLRAHNEEALELARDLGLTKLDPQTEDLYTKGKEAETKFDSYAKNGELNKAREALLQARDGYGESLMRSLPPRPVDARSVWLDRGTIVKAGNPNNLKNLIKTYKEAGFNNIYFETNNAGFAMYESSRPSPDKPPIVPKNPDIVAQGNWDPLKATSEACSEQGVNLHAWFWTNAVGNIAHNRHMGWDDSYPGPALTNHPNWALKGRRGELVPRDQTEYWLDMSNEECRSYARNMVLDVASKYKISGIQLDYIRWPFNERGREMGLNDEAIQQFKKDTGIQLSRDKPIDDETMSKWINWKVLQVDKEVEKTSQEIKKLNPNLSVSVAVYGMPLSFRLNSIQQVPEGWSKKAWIDIVNPMTYVTDPKDLIPYAGRVQNAIGYESFVYPGINLGRSDSASIAEQIKIARDVGTMGSTMFAAAQLNDKPQLLAWLKNIKEPVLSPHEKPVEASKLLFEGFADLARSCANGEGGMAEILSCSKPTQEVNKEIEEVRAHLALLSDKSSKEEFAKSIAKVEHLQKTVEDWLKIESFSRHKLRANYLQSWLQQCRAELVFAAHHK